jgi:hypothetical protein
MTKKPDPIYLDMDDFQHILIGICAGLGLAFPEKADGIAAFLHTWADSEKRTPAAREALHDLACYVDGDFPEPPPDEPQLRSLTEPELRRARFRVIDDGAA